MNVLLIEDNAKMAENISDVLRHEGYKVTTCLKGKDGLTKALVDKFNLIILDLALPDTDGIEICRKLRHEKVKVPILMLTARISLESKIEGLDCGADDYLTKPFLMDELLARLRALSRRNSKVKASTIIINENLIIDQKAKSVTVNEKLIKLSPTEYRILEFLAINRGESKSHLEIYESVWGSQNSDILTSDTLKVHIASLRKKIGKDVIKTVREQGYMIEG